MTACFRIRRASLGDSAWILPLSARLHDFGPPPWRPRDQMDQAVARTLEIALRTERPGVAVLVAEDAVLRSVGFVHVHEATDFFTGEPHGHVSDLVVTPDVERMGAGRALIRAAEDWALGRGYRFLTLNVFGENHRARAVYERAGFQTDTVRMTKLLSPPGGPARKNVGPLPPTA